MVGVFPPENTHNTGLLLAFVFAGNLCHQHEQKKRHKSEITDRWRRTYHGTEGTCGKNQRGGRDRRKELYGTVETRSENMNIDYKLKVYPITLTIERNKV